FQLKENGFAILRQNVKEIYRLRDLAVHPSGKMDAPILHPELDVGVEWRFFYFRYENALLAVRSAIQMLCELVSSGKPNDTRVQEYCNAVGPRIQPLLQSGAIK